MAYFNEDTSAGVSDMRALLETFIIDEANHMSEDERKDYLESAPIQAMVEAKTLQKSTIVRLSRADDMKRRIALAAMQKAKEQNSADWKRLKKAHLMKKQAIANIVKRYGNNVRRDVVKAQKAILKTNPRYFTKTNFNS